MYYGLNKNTQCRLISENKENTSLLNLVLKEQNKNFQRKKYEVNHGNILSFKDKSKTKTFKGRNMR